VDLPCSKRDCLIQEYVATVNLYGQAVSEKRSDSQIVRQLTQKCQNALKAVLDREQEHGCADKTGAKG
jgi:hypothetical protein